MSATPISETSGLDDPTQKVPEVDVPAKSVDQPLPGPIHSGYLGRLSARLRSALHR